MYSPFCLLAEANDMNRRVEGCQVFCFEMMKLLLLAWSRSVDCAVRYYVLFGSSIGVPVVGTYCSSYSRSAYEVGTVSRK